MKNNDCEILIGSAQTILPQLPDAHFQSCVTSPPYWGLRDYGIGDQIGAEMELGRYIDSLVGVFREVADFI